MLKALIFDVDGTLADTERDGHRVSFNLAFEEAGLQWFWSEELYGDLLQITGGKERISHYMETYLPDFHPQGDRAAFIAGLHKSKTAHYTRLLDEGRIPLRPGVERLLNEARQSGLTLAIATTTTPANVEALLKNSLGSESIEWFAVIAAGDVVPAKKPAPDIYLYALTQLGLAATDCIAFEDSRNGILSAQQAGLPVIITPNGYTNHDDFSGAALVVSDLGEPNAPFHPLAGEYGEATYVEVALIRQLHRQHRYG